jgi:hypothetical protein
MTVPDSINQKKNTLKAINTLDKTICGNFSVQSLITRTVSDIRVPHNIHPRFPCVWSMSSVLPD